MMHINEHQIHVVPDQTGAQVVRVEVLGDPAPGVYIKPIIELHPVLAWEVNSIRGDGVERWVHPVIFNEVEAGPSTEAGVIITRKAILYKDGRVWDVWSECYYDGTYREWADEIIQTVQSCSKRHSHDH